MNRVEHFGDSSSSLRLTLTMALVGILLCSITMAQVQQQAPSASTSSPAAPSAATPSSVRVQHYTEIPTSMGGNVLVSADGSTVVITGSNDDFAVWNVSSGIRNASAREAGLAKANFTVIDGISADGKVVFYKYVGKKNSNRELRWTSSEGMKEFKKLPEKFVRFGSVEKISADGSFLFGWELSGQTARFRLFRWSQTQGTQKIGDWWKNAHVLAASADGSALIGWHSEEMFGSREWFHWSTAGGVHDFESGFAPISIAADGNTVYGTRDHHLVRWTQASGAQEIGDLGAQTGNPTTVSNDGSVAIGLIADSENNRHLFRWTKERGVEIIPGFDEKTVYQIASSADGQIIAARVAGKDGQTQYIVTPMNELLARAEPRMKLIEAEQQAKAQAEAQAEAQANALAQSAKAQAEAEAVQRDIELNNRIDKVMNGGHPSQIYALAGEMEDQNRPDLAEKLYQQLIDQYPDDQWTAKAIDKKDKARQAAAEIASQPQSDQQQQADNGANAAAIEQAAAGCRAACKSNYNSCADQVHQQNQQATAGTLVGLLTHNTSMAATSAASSGSLSDCINAQNSCLQACQ
jgi:uncharacterized membrane protein